jgi:hypothetical protein
MPALTPAAMTADEARRLTERIKYAASELWKLVEEAHTRKAHRALGYETWDAYVDAEFGMSRARSYQLLDQARVVRELEGAASTRVDISEGVAREIKPHLPQVAREVRERVEAGQEPQQAVREAVEPYRPRTFEPPPAPTPRQPPNGTERALAQAEEHLRRAVTTFAPTLPPGKAIAEAARLEQQAKAEGQPTSNHAARLLLAHDAVELLRLTLEREQVERRFWERVVRANYVRKVGDPRGLPLNHPDRLSLEELAPFVGLHRTGVKRWADDLAADHPELIPTYTDQDVAAAPQGSDSGAVAAQPKGA